MERFFDLFDDRQLASDLFAIAEDTRIDTLVRREYGGIRGAWARTQENEMERRAGERAAAAAGARREPRARQPRRRAHDDLAAGAAGRAGAGGRGAVRLKTKGAIVEDTAEATLTLYDIASKVPNIAPTTSRTWSGRRSTKRRCR